MSISVIVPIYNVENYLKECLESLVNQNFNNYEVILVNDGSTDNSKIIAEEYAENYNHVKLINTSNNGLSAARNVGINNSTGKYLVFVDSDDYVDNMYLNDLYEDITKNNNDISICSYEQVYDDANRNTIEVMKIKEDVQYSNIEVLKIILEGEIQCYAWNKIYKSELFKKNNIEYPLGKLFEDIFTLILLITKSNNISFINKPLYKYRIRNGSITNKKSEQAVMDINYAIDQVNKLICESNLIYDVSDELVNFNMMYTLSGLDILGYNNEYKNRVFYCKYKEKFKKCYFEYDMKKVLLDKKIKKWVVRDFILFKLRLLPLKNKIRDNRKKNKS